MSELEVNSSSPASQQSTTQEETLPGPVPKDTVSALIELSRLLATIYAAELIAANDNGPPTVR